MAAQGGGGPPQVERSRGSRRLVVILPVSSDEVKDSESAGVKPSWASRHPSKSAPPH